MSSCPSDLRDYFFGEGSAAERATAEAHVGSCAACREELEALRLTQSALLTLRDEEPPRRIAFVSDKIFEPTLWQRLWSSGARLGFASAVMLSAAILLHGWMARPASEARLAGTAPAPAITRASTVVDVQPLVRQAVAESEARQRAQFEKALAAKQREWDLQHRATLAQVRDYVEVLEKQRNVMLVTSNRGEVQ